MNKDRVEDNALFKETIHHAEANKNFQERSDITMEIVGHKPGFAEKWALLIFIVLIICLLIGTWFIHYPDIIEGDAVFTAENAPKEIIARQSGKLMKLLVKNSQQVKQGEIIGLMESTASADEVLELSCRLETSLKLVSKNGTLEISQQFQKRLNNLGEMQEAYQTFDAAWQIYNDYAINGFYYKKKNVLNQEITGLKQMMDRVSEQKEIYRKDSELARKTFEMNEALFKEKVITAEEYRQARGNLLNKLLPVPQAEVSMLSQQNLILDKQKEIDQLGHDINQQQKIFEQALYTLKSQVDNWIKNYIIQAPTDGVLVFVLPLQKSQYISQGKLLGYVNPPDTHYYAELHLSQNNFGKIDTGMRVQLRLNAYPYQEVGFVSGRLDYISSVTVDSGFLGTIKLDKGFITNQNEKLVYKPGLKARALIITKDLPLFERMYHCIIKSTSVQSK
ncbi:HlyD family secretion protein [Mucilaginibacter aquaedulcis]|uniref:HlyD family secretion protein n=1 Tax=Mucilaginibacter aquaedulcis TaxID=1187081 RepID=UPI0025B5462E|nr:HlyD family efflux transporter periplasmic adaptor subunit [Mucilaginibacter aquaedulcis]MDN3548895.1 HlyD family efflux transporter periplasmic adaptor subunit [Mucilaginibacter aquaedulcis]